MSDKGAESETVAPKQECKQQHEQEVNTPQSKQTPARLGSVLLKPNHGGELTRHSALCDRLKLTDSIKCMANSMWATLPTSDIDKEESWMWYICCIYIATIDGRLPYGLSDPQASSGMLSLPSVTVSDLLMAADISMVEFLKKMRQLRSQVALSDAVKHHFGKVQRKFLITCHLYHKFEKIFEEIFQSETKNCLPVNGFSCEQKEFLERKKFAWTLAIYAKNSEFDLVTIFHLLLCCLNYVMRMTPGFQLKPPFDSLRVAIGANDEDLAMLRSLCELYSANFDEVLLVQTDCLAPVIETLPQNSGNIDVDQMSSVYRSNYKNAGDIDELMFLDEEPHLVHGLGEQNNNANGSSQVGEVHRVPVMTPIRAAMSSASQLRQLLSETSDEGSETLQGYFKKCAINPQPFISSLLFELKPVFVDGYTSLMGRGSRETAEMRLKMAVRLYYRVMETLLKQEGERLSQVHFSHLLHNRTSHKCLLACAVEVVMAAYSNDTLKLTSKTDLSPGANCGQHGTLFPWILNLYDIQGFDLFIVLENFIQAEPKLTKEVIKHLQTVEERLLESESWQQNSPVFEALKHSEILAPSEVATESNILPLKIRGPQGSSIDSPRMQRSQGLSQFLNKVCRLAYKRVQLLCTDLGIGKDTQLKIWTCVEYCPTRQTGLLRRRHLDQVLMCCIYAVCRVVNIEITFKAIISVYKEMAQATQEVYKKILVSEGEYDSIIVFYNRIFTQQLKNYVLQFATNKLPTDSVSPAHRASPSTPRSTKDSPLPLQASPGFSKPVGKNFYISPFKSTQFKTPVTPSKMTPRTRKLVSIHVGDGFGSAEKFRGINNWMKNKNFLSPSGKKPSKRLAFEQMEGPGMGNEEDSEPMLLGKRKRTANDED